MRAPPYPASVPFSNGLSDDVYGAAGVAAGQGIGLDQGRGAPDDGWMCGRFLLQAPVADLQRAFGFEERPNLGPRYNIAPTQSVAEEEAAAEIAAAPPERTERSSRTRKPARRPLPE